MSKKLTFSYDGKDYTLEFTRNSIRQMERQGFVIDEVDKKPMTNLPALFAGAFIANHNTVKRDKIDKIYDLMNDKTKLFSALTEMYGETLETLMESPDEGNVAWTPNWEPEN